MIFSLYILFFSLSFSKKLLLFLFSFLYLTTVRERQVSSGDRSMEMTTLSTLNLATQRQVSRFSSLS